MLTLGALIAFWLFLFPHGLADNGDFYRAMHNLGLSHPLGSETDDLFHYFDPKYHLSSYYVEDKVSYFTSETVFIWLSIRIDRLFMPAGVYDIRFLCALYAAVFLFASWLILRRLERAVRFLFPGLAGRKRNAVVWLFTGLYVFIFGDFGYLLYFNSLFGEPVFYVSLLLFTAVSAELLTTRRHRRLWLCLYLLSAVTLIAAKQQGAVLGIVLAPFTLCLLRLEPSFLRRAAVGGMAAVIGAVSVLSYAGIGDEIRYINSYHTMTMGVMAYETDMAGLESLNVPPQMLLLKGTSAYDTYPAVLPDSTLMYRQLYDRATPVRIAVFYLSHPAALAAALNDAAKASYSIKPTAVGNFRKSDGRPPGAQSYFFSGWSVLKEHLFPQTFGFILIFYLALALAAGVSFFRTRNRRARSAVLFVWSLELMSLLQIATAFIGSGKADLAKHLFYHSVLFDLLFAGSVFALSGWLYRAGNRKH